LHEFRRSANAYLHFVPRQTACTVHRKARPWQRGSRLLQLRATATGDRRVGYAHVAIATAHGLLFSAVI